MEFYTCPRCHYTAKQKSHYVNHLHRKYPCEALYSSDTFEEILSQLRLRKSKTNNNGDEKHKCSECNKQFSHSSALSRHKRTHMNSATHSHSHNITTNCHNTNCNNTTSINNSKHTNCPTINLNFYGKESLDEIFADKSDMLLSFLKALGQNGNDNGIVRMYKHVHHNDEYPENKNVKLSREHHPTLFRIFVEDEETKTGHWKDVKVDDALYPQFKKFVSLLLQHNQLSDENEPTQEQRETFDLRQKHALSIIHKAKGGRYVPTRDAITIEERQLRKENII